MSLVPATKSHPSIRFERIPIVEGPLSGLDKKRHDILSRVVESSAGEFEGSNLELLLGEALYRERFRLKRFHPNPFTRTRKKNDIAVWNSIQAGLLHPSAEVDRRPLLEKVLWHYAEEIGGHFDPSIYKFATHVIPFGFSWFLNAASVRRFLPWGLTESLSSRLHILGEIPALQKLSRQGTILLVPTHQSNMDSILIGYVIYLMGLPPFAYGAGLNLYSNPALSFFMGRLGAYTVDRQKTNEIYKLVLKNYSTEILRNGVHSIFFPGGGRVRSGALESKVKLGLLGTALQAQIENLQSGKPQPNVYVVPMTMSYHFVLEAASLIEDYLAEAGKHRYIIMDDESWQPTKVFRFFFKLFSSQSAITVRVGKPLDVFGNPVDEEGRSIGPNGTVIDPRLWLTTRGVLRTDPQRDHEYTRLLGKKIVERFHSENTVLTSHVAAFAFFETLRRKYPELDLFRFLRLSLAQRSLPFEEFLPYAENIHREILSRAEQGQFYVSEELRTVDSKAWIMDGVKQLGLLHESAVIRVQDGAIWTEDMNLLYYYRNRLAGYGLSYLAEPGARTNPGKYDSKGFLV